ncbi:hypothetical protein [Halomonas sp.]|uniref:hypothetical protein n=1 Tax=Halomonas sp. TaxID=1486246 RepID=UPI003F9549FC
MFEFRALEESCLSLLVVPTPYYLLPPADANKPEVLGCLVGSQGRSTGRRS